MKKWIDEKPEIRKMTDTEAAWLAGVIDGEGSIGLYDYGREGRRVCIQLFNTNKAFIKRARDIVGCGSQVKRIIFHKSHKGRKPIYYYSLKGSNRCYWVIKQMIPHLVIKKRRALNIIQELEDKPFGRWINATPEYRKIQSERVKKEWQNPIIRKKRIEGLKKYYASRR